MLRNKPAIKSNCPAANLVLYHQFHPLVKSITLYHQVHPLSNMHLFSLGCLALLVSHTAASPVAAAPQAVPRLFRRDDGAGTCTAYVLTTAQNNGNGNTKIGPTTIQPCTVTSNSPASTSTITQTSTYTQPASTSTLTIVSMTTITVVSTSTVNHDVLSCFSFELIDLASGSRYDHEHNDFSGDHDLHTCSSYFDHNLHTCSSYFDYNLYTCSCYGTFRISFLSTFYSSCKLTRLPLDSRYDYEHNDFSSNHNLHACSYYFDHNLHACSCYFNYNLHTFSCYGTLRISFLSTSCSSCKLTRPPLDSRYDHEHNDFSSNHNLHACSCYFDNNLHACSCHGTLPISPPLYFHSYNRLINHPLDL